MLTQVPLWRRILRRLRQTRMLEDHEWSVGFDPDAGEVKIRFFAPRMPSVFHVVLVGESFDVASIQYGAGDEATSIDFGVTREGPDGPTWSVDCVPAKLVETDEATIRLTVPRPDLRGHVVMHVVSFHEPDLDLVRNAHAAASEGRWQTAVENLVEYTENYSPDNPAVCCWIAECQDQLGRLDVAEEFAARATGYGDPQACSDLYRGIRDQRPSRPAEDYKSLASDADHWRLGAQHGVIVLDRQQRHVLGLGAFELRQFREAIQVRNTAAARMLGRLEFPFSGSRQLLLHTSLRVVHSDGEVESVPLERFTVGDHESDNVFITLEAEKAGRWILPDLAPGDVVEWTYDLLHRNGDVDGTTQAFSLSSLHHAHFATLQARHDFVVPEGFPVRFSIRNSELEPTRESTGSRTVHSFAGQRFVPAKQTGFVYENHWLNPLVACATEGPDWSDVARLAGASNFGEAPIEETVPAPLDALLDGGPKREGLERAFYWIRDNLRYASVRSGSTRIGREERGKRIVEAGVGDCKDKSYLLALVCRRLDLPYEFVCVSTDNGILIEDLPANQFDHVFLRARLDGEWLWLDAANPLSTFGPAPAWCQGMKALVLAEPASIVEIPVEPPAANRFEIRECLEEFRDGRVGGRFVLTAEGQNARAADERWKAVSLSMEDPLRAGQEELSQYLPHAIVDDYHRGADTSDSSRFLVEGIHSRGPVVVLPRDGRTVLPLSWTVPTLPLGYWRILHLDRLFVVDLLSTIRVTLRLEGDVRRAVDDVSRTEPLENELARVSEEVVEEADALEIRRTLALRRKILRGEETGFVPESLEHFEKALRLVVAFGPDGSR